MSRSLSLIASTQLSFSKIVFIFSFYNEKNILIKFLYFFFVVMALKPTYALFTMNNIVY